MVWKPFRVEETFSVEGSIWQHLIVEETFSVEETMLADGRCAGRKGAALR